MCEFCGCGVRADSKHTPGETPKPRGKPIRVPVLSAPVDPVTSRSETPVHHDRSARARQHERAHP